MMILCISANPAIDRRVYLDQLVTGCVNRVHSVTDAPGGKAAHVAMAAALGAARVLLAYGAQSAAVTLGKDGLVWLPMGDAVPRFASAVRVAVRSTVGCGDATLAAFAVAAVRRLSTIETLRLAVASAAANCLAEMPGRIQRMAVAQLLSLVNCDELAYD